MNERQLRDDFKQYDFQNWKSILDFVFGNVEYFSSPHNPFAETKKVVSGRQFGRIKLEDNKSIALFEVQVDQTINIEKNRQGLREIAARHIDQNITHGALVIFYSPTQGKYRLTFIAKWSELNLETGEFQKGETPKKRFTYLLGEREGGVTAAKRLLELATQKPLITINHLINAFSVEPIKKEFFKKYKEHYERFWRYIDDNEQYRKILIDNEKENEDDKRKPIRDFSKKLLGRIVFLHFLQKKGWMGCPVLPSKKGNREIWENGDPNFMYNLYEGFNEKQNFYSKCLTKLFFNTLNESERDNNIFNITRTRVPYLNGGLFENQHPETDIIDFPSGYFLGLFEFFSQYNFTIDENSPDEQEIGIDPEMLGHIFENLLEENREKGTFYTPQEIVHYMCQQSLLQFLRTHLPECKEDDSPAFKSLEAFLIKTFIPDPLDTKNFIVKNAKRIDLLLHRVKICDPAIGSGAFPMGILQLIFQVRMALGLTRDRASLKKDIIQNNIYGVDIESGAVDIARLRFWLALVVEEDKPQPLPNLDYKIMQGNSLFERFEDVDLKFEPKRFKVKLVKEIDLFGNPINSQTSITEYLQTKEDTKEFNLTELEEKYFNSNDAAEKQEIKRRIDAFEKDFIRQRIENRKQDLQILIETKKKSAEKRKQQELQQHQQELQRLQEAKLQLDKMKSDNKPYFLWHLYFMDVFQEGGFDIVIGNPPYLRIQGIRKDNPKMADRISEVYKSATGSFDLYVVFVEKGLHLLKDDGLLNFIMPVKWTNAAFGQGLRQVVLSGNYISKIISFEAYQVFNVSTYTGIQWFKKNSDKLFYTALNKDIPSLEELGTFLKNLKSEDYNIINTKNLNTDSWTLTDTQRQALLQKLQRQPHTMKDVFSKIFQGIATSADKIYVLKLLSETENTYICYSNSLEKQVELEKGFAKPFLMGKDVERYETPNPKNIVLFPYLIESGAASLMSQEYINENFPLSWQYLIDNRKWLEEREKGKMKHSKFYAYIYPKSLVDFSSTKLLTPDIANKSELTIDEGGLLYHTTTIYSLVVRQGIDEDLKYFLGLLNSKLLFFFLSTTGNVLRGGYFRFKTDYLKPFPIKRIDFSVKDEAQVYSDIVNIVTLVLERKKKKLDTDKWESKVDALVFHLYDLTEDEVFQVLDSIPDLSIKGRNAIHNEYRNIQNKHFKAEV